MRPSIIRSAIVTVMLLAFAQPAMTQTLKGPVSDKPLTEGWAPSKWGANDRAGSANYTSDPANVAKALATIKQNIWAPLRMIGATGSPANPVVIY